MQEGQELESDGSVQEPEVIETSAPAKTPLIPKHKFTWIWVVLALLVIAGLFTAIYTVQHKRSATKSSVNGVKAQNIDTSNLTPTAGTFDVKSDRVVINGQLQAAQSLVVLPSGVPTDAQLGQIYLDQNNKGLFYYNGTAFVPLGASTTTNVTNLTQVTNNYSTTAATGVSSLQGLTGELLLQGSGGLSVSGSGTDITLSLPQDLSDTASPQFANISLTGNVTTGTSGSVESNTFTHTATGQDISVDAGANQIIFTANGLTFILPSTGGSGQTICTTGVSCASGGGQAVLLAPNNSGVPAAQVNASAVLPSIFLNNTGGANLLELQDNGSDVFTVGSDGSLAIQGGNFSQTGTGTFSTGTGTVSLNGDTTVTNSKNFTISGGNISQTGTGTFSTGTGSVSLNGNTTVTSGKTLTVNGVTNLQADSTTLLMVQNAAGTDLLNVNSTNLKVTVNGDNPATLQTWQTTTALAAPGRYSHGSIIVGGNLYVVSGDEGSSSVSISYATINANGSLGSWNSTTNSPTSSRYGVILGGNGHLYMLGGQDSSSLSNASDDVNYARVNSDGSISNWYTTETKLVANMAGGSGVFANGYIYVAGGSTTFSGSPSLPVAANATSTVQYAPVNSDGSIGSFVATGALPSARVGGSMAVANGYVYYIGGQNTSGTAQSQTYFAKISSDGTLTAANSSVTPTVTPHGTPGVTSYSYVVTAVSAAGDESIVSNTGLTTTGNATLSGSNYNAISWSSVSGAVSYNIYRSASGGTPSSTGLIGTSVSASFNDTGLSASASVPTNVWNWSATMPAGRSYESSVVLNGYLYVMGGGSSATNANNTVYAAAINSDGSLGSFSAVSSLNTATASASAVTANGYIYTLGGITGSTPITTVQYTSTPRLMVAGSLDLVGLSGQNLLEGGTGGTLTAGDTRVVGTLNVSDEARFMDGVVVNGNLQAGGQVTFKNIADSETAFQIQNASGDALLLVDTSNTIITPGFSRTATIVSRSFNNRITDSTYDIGQGISIAMGSDGKPIIVAVTSTNILSIYKCFVTDCSTGASTPVTKSSITYSTSQTSVAIGSDRLPIIAYRNTTNSRLGVLHCGNQSCTSGNVETNTITHQAGETQPGVYPSIAIGADGYPIIASEASNSNDLVFTKCDNATCSSYESNAAVGDEPVGTNYGQYASLAVNPVDNIPTAISYVGGTSYADIAVTRCNDTVCSYSAGTTTNVISSPDDIGKLGSIAFSSDGIPSIAVYNATRSKIFYVRCGDSSCSSGNYTTNLSPASPGLVAQQPVGIIFGSDGLPLITYKWTNGGGIGSLGIIHCENVQCTQTKFVTLDISSTAQDGSKGQVLFNYNTGLPLIVTGSDVTGAPSNNAIAVAVCADVTCTKSSASVYGGGVALGTQNIPFSNVLTDSINDGRPDANLRLTNNGDFYANSLSVDTSGKSIFQSTNGSALQVKSSNTGGVALNIDTYGANNNLIRNYGDFETNIYGWDALRTGAISQDPNYSYSGDSSLAIATTAAGDGVKYKVNLTQGRMYAVRFKALASSGTVNGMSFGYAADGSTETDCIASQTLSNTDWNQFSCIFTPGAVSGNPYFYIKTSNTSVTINVDDVILVAGGSASTITGGEFENASDVTAWSVLGSAARSQNSTAAYVNSGTYSMQVVTGTTNPSGVKFPIVLNPNTTYTVQFSIKSTATMSALYYGYSSDGTTTNQSDCNSTAATSNNAAFTKYSCAFTTPSDISGTPYFYIQSDSTTNYTFYIDSLSLIRSSRKDYIANGDVEAGTTDWSAKGSSTIEQSFQDSYLNQSSMKVTTTTAANDGVKYNVTLAPSTTFTARFYAKLESGTLSTLNFGYAQDGSSETDCSTGNSLSTSGWTQLQCSFTTGTSIPNTSSKAYFYIKKTTGASAPVIFVDDLRIDYGSYAGGNQDYKTTINGIINSPTSFQTSKDSTNAFQILTSAGSSLFTVDSLNGRVGIGTGTPQSGLDASSVEARFNNASVNFQGSVFFNGYWDGSNTRYLGTNPYAEIGQEGGSGGFNFRIADSGTAGSIASPTTVLSIGSNGAAIFQNKSNSVTAFQIQNTANASLLVADTTNMRIIVTGHLTSSNSSGTTTVAAGAAANCSGSASGVSLSGNDTAGTITFTTSTTCSAGALVTVTFANAYVTAPRVVITPSNAASSGLQYYNGTTSTTTFTVDTNNAASDTTQYKFNYLIIE